MTRQALYVTALRGWKAGGKRSASQQEVSIQRLSHGDIDKWKLFKRHGASLATALKSRKAEFDGHLNHVRLDR